VVILSKIHLQRQAVLIELLNNQAILVNNTYRWVNKKKGLPSLRNEVTSSLFCADYVTSIETDKGWEMILTTVGKINAEEYNKIVKNGTEPR
jgi:hypothetical protein